MFSPSAACCARLRPAVEVPVLDDEDVGPPTPMPLVVVVLVLVVVLPPAAVCVAEDSALAFVFPTLFAVAPATGPVVTASSSSRCAASSNSFNLCTANIACASQCRFSSCICSKCSCRFLFRFCPSSILISASIAALSADRNSAFILTFSARSIFTSGISSKSDGSVACARTISSSRCSSEMSRSFTSVFTCGLFTIAFTRLAYRSVCSVSSVL
mmetsp:Transcript_28745/g.72792  ORF Transcript_28745/g.72792 Transcript_28745/m.72792 type:complete len:214 (+) Transcript_28745:1668-2309(+)